MAIYRGNGGSLDGLVESEVILLAISQGGTGSSTASGARTNLGLGTAATTDASAYATAAQGALADTATQPGDLGTAAAEDVGYFATAAQGALADSAVQPGDLATVATTGSYNDLTDKPTAGSGTVTSVALSVPTGLSVSGSPVTTSGTFAVTYSTGYAIPTTAKQTNWDTAYGWGNHASAGYLTSETYTGTVTSVAATVPTGFAISGSPITSSGTLALTFAAGYALPTTAKQTNWDTAYGWGNHASAGYLTSETYTGTVTSVAMTVPTGLSVSGTPITSSGTLAVSLTAGYSIPTTSSQSNWDTAYTDRLKWDGGATGLTASTGRTSLGATTVGSNLFTLTNPSSVTFVRLNADNTVSALSASDFRTAIGAGTSSTTGTVTSVDMSVPTGLSVSGNPITSSGTLAVTFSAGYSIPTTANQTNWSTAYSWGNHASAGYLTSSSTLDASKLSGTIDGGTY
jgi:hypothetical protein